MINVAIVGGGSSAHTLIPFLSGGAYFVSLLTSKPHKWSKVVRTQYEDSLGKIVSCHEGLLNKVSDNPADILPDADIVILCMPVSKYRTALHNIAPHINRNKKVCVGTIYGQGGFNWMVAEIKPKFSLDNVVTFAVGLIPWICRIKEYGGLGVTYGPKTVNIAAVSPASEFKFLNDTLFEDICFRHFGTGKFSLARNFISLTLSVDNQIIHTSRLFGLYLKHGGKWAKKEHVPLFYRDYDQLSADLLQLLDDDYTMIRNGIRERCPQNDYSYMLDYLSLERLSYSSSNANILESFISSKTLWAIQTPVVQNEEGFWVFDKNHRFFSDDIIYGLCIARWIAERLSLDVPTIDRILSWAQDLLGMNIIDDHGLLLPNNNTGPCYISGVPSVYGYSGIDEIID